MVELMKERENDQSADLIGPEVFRTVYGAPSPDHNVIYLREYEINRNSVPEALEIFAQANEEFKNEDAKLLALLPLIADKMNSLYAIYYFSSISSMGEIVERVGLSENFQRLVNKGNKIGTLTSSNIFVSV